MAIELEGGAVHYVLPERSGDRVLAERVHEAHDRLRELGSYLVPNLDAPDGPRQARRAFREISRRRLEATRIFGEWLPRVGDLGAAVVRTDRRIEGEEALRTDKNDGFWGCTNDAQRKARLRTLTSRHRDLLAGLRSAEARLEELARHARLVLDELQAAHESVSRALATIEHDGRLARSDS